MNKTSKLLWLITKYVIAVAWNALNATSWNETWTKNSKTEHFQATTNWIDETYGRTMTQKQTIFLVRNLKLIRSSKRKINVRTIHFISIKCVRSIYVLIKFEVSVIENLFRNCGQLPVKVIRRFRLCGPTTW